MSKRSNDRYSTTILHWHIGFQIPERAVCVTDSGDWRSDRCVRVLRVVVHPGEIQALLRQSFGCVLFLLASASTASANICRVSAVDKILAPGYTTILTLGSGYFFPAGVAVDANGNVFVADTNNDEVKVILAPGWPPFN